ncbi:helicase C-terminal domain-containing protein [Amycolatopsis sp. GM8]|uniref:C-terminal helicase domain-containing protein n=1 Tax=Amycolatopsis sp. GM8 TaxID=2896530 RepID=UPI001F16585E|nr:helicase C-terminal domain-containing protein [Amycolatopsis sp. GM8]
MGEVIAEPITLPGSYVGEHVTLGYASTIHSGQGLTVDTSHAVVSESTGQEARYVGLTRGRHGNTAHVATFGVPKDANGIPERQAERPAAPATSLTVYSNACSTDWVGRRGKLRPFDSSEDH